MKFDFQDERLYNSVYIPIFHDEKRYNVIYGGRNSAKSHSIGQEILMNLLSPEFFRFIIMRKFRISIKDSQWQTIVDLIKLYELQNHFHITVSPLEIVCIDNGNKVFARGLDKDENTKSIKDATGIWYEEADEITESAFLESSISIRTPRRRVLKEYLTFNPQQEQSWINSFFFPDKQSYEKEDGSFHWVKSIRKDTTILHTTYKDNRFCSDRDANFLEELKTKDLNHYKVRTLGLWGGALKGIIYDQWTFCNSIPDEADIAFGLDFGFNNPTAFVAVGYHEKKLYCQELLYTSSKTPDDIAGIIESNFKELVGNKVIIVDSANPDVILALARKGFNVFPAQKGPGSVYHGIMLVKEFDIHVTRDSDNIIRELNSYVWKPTVSGISSDEPVKMNDHTPDAIRYVVQTYGSRYWKEKPQVDNSALVSVARPTRQKERFF